MATIGAGGTICEGCGGTPVDDAAAVPVTLPGVASKLEACTPPCFQSERQWRKWRPPLLGSMLVARRSQQGPPWTTRFGCCPLEFPVEHSDHKRPMQACRHPHFRQNHPEDTGGRCHLHRRPILRNPQRCSRPSPGFDVDCRRRLLN